MNYSNSLVSIIIPTYNREDVLLETLNSVLNQNYINWECIIVDDGSTDNSLNIIEKKIKEDRRFIFLQRDVLVKGAPVCRNIGFSKSIGDYILFLDSDDIIAQNFLEYQVETLKKSRLGASISKIYRFQDSINSTLNWYTDNDNISLENFLVSKCTWRTSAVLWRREAIKKIGKFNTNLSAFQDWLIYIKHFANNDSFEVNNHACLYYRENWSKHQISNKSDALYYAYYFSRRQAFITLFKAILTEKSIRMAFLKSFCIDYNLIKKKKDILLISLIYLILNRNLKDFIKSLLLLINMILKDKRYN